jgi:glutamine synthetase
MSLETVLREVQQLSEEEKHAVLEVLQSHFTAEYVSLNEEELQQVRSRLAHYHAHPETGISWKEIRKRYDF